MFKKICHNDRCDKGTDGKRKEFDSPARNTKYCSDECLDVGRKRSVGRAKRKRMYRRNSEEFRRMSMSRKQAREQCIAVHALSCCTRCGNAFNVRDLQDHHRDGDPFNNTDDNLTLVCEPCHSKSDTEWRKAKKENSPIQDMRVYKQIGVVVLDKDGRFSVVYPGSPEKHPV